MLGRAKLAESRSLAALIQGTAGSPGQRAGWGDPYDKETTLHLDCMQRARLIKLNTKIGEFYCVVISISKKEGNN